MVEPSDVGIVRMERQLGRLLAAALHLLRGRLANHRHRLGHRQFLRRRSSPMRSHDLHLFIRRGRQLLDSHRDAAGLHVRPLLHQALPLLRVLHILELRQKSR